MLRSDLEHPTRIHYVDAEKPPKVRRMAGGSFWKDPTAYCGQTFNDFKGNYNHSMYAVSAVKGHVGKGWTKDMCPHCLENMGVELLVLYD